MPSPAPAKPHRVIRTHVRTHLQTSVKEHFNRGRSLDAPGTPSAEEVFERLNGSGYAAAPSPKPPSIERPVMTVQDLTQGDYLEPGDVILMTRLGSFFAWLLRFFNNSDFAHAAMVFQTPRQLDGIDQTFLIETSMGGVEIVSLSQFLAPTEVYPDTGLPPDFVVGVKRLETDWAGVPHRRMAASRMLHYIENHEYNFRLLAALASPRTKSLYFKIRESLRGNAPAIGDFLKNGNNFLPGNFICSGFVQYAYVSMVTTAAKRGLIREADAERALEDVIFCPNATVDTKMEELLACTPKYLADTEKLQWKYLIHKGEVFHVTSPAEAQRFFRETLPKRIPEQDDA